VRFEDIGYVEIEINIEKYINKSRLKRRKGN
jgi:hypothetical protein